MEYSFASTALEESVPKRWRVGIIGCGWAGERHAQALAKLKDRAELCAVADSDPVTAQSKARAWHVPRWTDDYTQLLHAADLDAACLCLPHSLHASAAIAAARAGLHVLVEKPLAATLDQADAMLAAAAAASTHLLVAETARFNAAYLKAAALIRSGELGDLFLLRISREHQMHAYLRQRPWFLSDPAGGIMYSGGIHDFETLRMLAGKVEHVYALPARKALPEMRGDDSSVALVGLHSGAAAVLAESFSLRTDRPGVHITAHGSRGSLWLYGSEIRLYAHAEDGRPEDVREWTVDPGDTFYSEIAHWLDCLDRGLGAGQASPISAVEQYKPLLAVLAAYASMRQGKRITLTEFGKS
jgi:predicted dehydrogenase